MGDPLLDYPSNVARVAVRERPTTSRSWQAPAAQVPLALLLASLSMATASAWAGCEFSQTQIPVRIVDFRPIATLTLDGTEVPLLVDSGAFFSMLSASSAAQLARPLRNLPAGKRITPGRSRRSDAFLGINRGPLRDGPSPARSGRHRSTSRTCEETSPQSDQAASQ